MVCEIDLDKSVILKSEKYTSSGTVTDYNILKDQLYIINEPVYHETLR